MNSLLPVAIEQYLMESGFTGTEILVLKKLMEEDSFTMRELASKTGKSTGVLDQCMKKLLGKMYRATNVRNTAEGNGFGLYVAKGAIEGQGGKLWFESEEGKGTTFHFELPMKEAPKGK